MRKRITGLIIVILLLLSTISVAWCEVAVGNEVSFGRYPQHMKAGNTPADPEPIKWQVLDVKGDKALLLAKQPLLGMPFNSDDHFLYDVTWEKCTLRAWLNSDFMKEAFSNQEQQAIIKTLITTPDYTDRSFIVSGGNDTEDWVFLLSADEAEKYLKTDASRQCCPTDYAVTNGVGNSWGSYSDDTFSVTKYTDNVSIWWLRSPGAIGHYTAYCNWDGSIRRFGWYSGGFFDREDGELYPESCSVRPAIWVNIHALSK